MQKKLNDLTLNPVETMAFGAIERVVTTFVRQALLQTTLPDSLQGSAIAVLNALRYEEDMDLLGRKLCRLSFSASGGDLEEIVSAIRLLIPASQREHFITPVTKQSTTIGCGGVWPRVFNNNHVSCVFLLVLFYAGLLSYHRTLGGFIMCRSNYDHDAVDTFIALGLSVITPAQLVPKETEAQCNHAVNTTTTIHLAGKLTKLLKTNNHRPETTAVTVSGEELPLHQKDLTEFHEAYAKRAHTLLMARHGI